jgi:hypothetical protein
MTYNRKDLSVQVNIKTNKGYTMREIGALDDRIKRLEYYTVLNALELDAKTLSIKDDTGTIERFKNGIFADPFNDFTVANKDDKEFRIALQGSKSIARPLFEDVDLSFEYAASASSNIKVMGKIGMLDYDNEYYGGNKYATTYRNCTEAFWNFTGRLFLYPDFDNKNVVNDGMSGPMPQLTIDLAKGFSDLASTGVFAKNLDDIVGEKYSSRADTVADWHGGGTDTTHYFAQTVVKRIMDITVTAGIADLPANVSDEMVTNVGTLAYMRSRFISCVVSGMKPNTRMYVYFDKVKVSEHCAPAYPSAQYVTSGRIDSTKTQSLYSSDSYKPEDILTKNGNFGDDIYSNANGDVFFQFLLPSNKFRCGDRTMLVTNVDDITAEGAIITRAEAVYNSSALSVTKQKFQIKTPAFKYDEHKQPVIVKDLPPEHTYVEPPPPYIPPAEDPPPQTWTDSGSDPIGETFEISYLSDVNQPGVYLTQIGVYFKKKSASQKIECMVVGTNFGIPNRKDLLGSAELLPQYVNISDDASAETIFTFDHPILLESDKTYAFLLRPEANNPDYEAWISVVGGKDVLTKESINKQPYTGVMYVSSNCNNWNSVQSSDIKFRIYRAKFTSSFGVASFRNSKNDFLTLSAFLRTSAGNPIKVGDVVYAANTLNTLQTLTNTSLYPFGIINSMNELTGKITLEKSNGLFNSSTYPNLKIYRVAEVGNVAQIIIDNLVANCTVSSIDDLQYHSIKPMFGTIEPIKTTTRMDYTATANTGAKDSSATNVLNESLYEYNDYERVIRSYSNEVAAGIYNNGTATHNIVLSTTDTYLSPVVDFSAKTVKAVKNILNNDVTNEHTRYGNSLNKYISKNVVLKQEAEDLLVYVTGYRPNGTDIKVYAKFLNKNDSDLFQNKSWTLLTNQQLGSYSSSNDRNDYREYVYSIPSGNTVAYQANAYLDPTSTDPDPVNVITYYDTNNEKYTGYNNFAIKIVLLGTNPVILPSMRDVRGIALMR